MRIRASLVPFQFVTNTCQNSLMYFSAIIFTLLGFDNPTLTSMSVAITNFAFTCLALVLIDRVGRRRILLVSVPLMVVGLVFSSIGFHFVQIPHDDGSIHTRDETGQLSSRTAPLLVLASIMLYVAAYALGMGNVPWMQSELFPLSVRSLGSGIGTSMNWGANFVVGLTFLPMIDHLTPTFTFIFYAVICVAGWILIRLIYPETQGLSLEETGALLAHGWGVQRSSVPSSDHHRRDDSRTRALNIDERPSPQRNDTRYSSL